METLLQSWAWISARVAEPQSGWVYLVSTALIAAAGAYFGASGAQRAINRDSRYRRRREALTTVNAAQSLTSVIFNQAASLKKQHHLPTLERWQKERDRVVRAIEARQPFNPVALHFQTPPPIQFPIQALADLIYGKLTLNGRPLGALAELVQAEHSLNTLVDAHDALRQEFEGKPPEYVAPRYLALETENGQDTRYKDVCSGFVDVLDDLLFFSEVLGKDLLEYGHDVRDQAPRRERKRLPKMNVRVGIVPGNEYLIPKHQHHQEWYDNHRMVKEPRASVWRRLWPIGKDGR